MKFIWIPRILTFLFAVFILLFSFDTLSNGGSFWQDLVGFIIHSIPSILTLFILISLRNHALLSGIALIALSVGMMFWFETYRYPLTFLLLTVPLFVSGALFFIAYGIQKRRA